LGLLDYSVKRYIIVNIILSIIVSVFYSLTLAASLHEEHWMDVRINMDVRRPAPAMCVERNVSF